MGKQVGHQRCPATTRGSEGRGERLEWWKRPRDEVFNPNAEERRAEEEERTKRKSDEGKKNSHFCCLLFDDQSLVPFSCRTRQISSRCRTQSRASAGPLLPQSLAEAGRHQSNAAPATLPRRRHHRSSRRTTLKSSTARLRPPPRRPPLLQHPPRRLWPTKSPPTSSAGPSTSS